MFFVRYQNERRVTPLQFKTREKNKKWEINKLIYSTFLLAMFILAPASSNTLATSVLLL